MRRIEAITTPFKLEWVEVTCGGAAVHLGSDGFQMRAGKRSLNAL